MAVVNVTSTDMDGDGLSYRPDDFLSRYQSRPGNLWVDFKGMGTCDYQGDPHEALGDWVGYCTQERHYNNADGN